jgi:NADH:ubiquinone oxidoreductase subunit 3 (subunit A)
MYSYLYCLAYKILFITFCCGLLIIFILISLASLVAPSRPTFEKLSAYECGFHPFQTARLPVDIHFYVIGILFLIFDMEIIFLYPWFSVAYLVGWVGLFNFLFFFLILVLGFIYEYYMNVLAWNK